MALTAALDPGSRNAAIAWFEDDALSHVDEVHLFRADVVSMIAALYRRRRSSDGGGRILVSEWPVKYPHRPATHRDVEDLRDVVRGVEAWGWRATSRTAPFRWKGNVPKNIHHERTEALLRPEERAVWGGLTPDGRDAVGLGVWFLARGRVNLP